MAVVAPLASSAGNSIDSPQLILVADEEIASTLHREGEVVGDDIVEVLRHYDAEITPLFPGFDLDFPPRVSPPRGGGERADAELRRFLSVASPPAAMVALRDALLRLEGINRAYIKPEAVLASGSAGGGSAAERRPAPNDLAGILGPGGLDVEYARRYDGATGAGITIFDIEAAWQSAHETLSHLHLNVQGPERDDREWRSHGTAVLSLLAARDPLQGIAPDVTLQLVSIEKVDTAQAVYISTGLARQGDVILIEWQRRGPLSVDGVTDAWVPTEWWSDELAAIRNATQRGVIVVEAAGNGGGYLLHPVYDAAPPRASRTWSNPFRRTGSDSGAILVGAGSCGHSGPDRSRHPDSNWGPMIDVQGWGEHVISAGYGNLWRGADRTDEKQWYSGTFGGTSASAAVVAGVLACVQGALREAGRPLLTSLGARDWLRATGHAQTNAPGRPAIERIGNRPSLATILSEMLGPR